MYFILAALVLIPITIIAALIYAFKKLSRKQFFLLVLLLLAIPYMAFKIHERSFMLGVVPDALQVTSISYSKEESWGFGPGGNEAGIRVYPLRKEISEKIKEEGISFFETMPPNQKERSRYWQGKYEQWSETPIQPDTRWELTDDNDKPKKSSSLNIYDYICRYGFCIDIKPSVVEEANAIVNSTGSYYAYGRVGLIIVSPERNLVLYIYNG